MNNTSMPSRRHRKKRPKIFFVCFFLLAFLATIAAALSRFPLKAVSSPPPSPAKKPTSETASVIDSPQEKTSEPEPKPEPPEPSQPETPPASYDYTKPVPESAACEDAYFDDSLFIGNSITDGIAHYGIIKNAAVWASNGLMVDEALVKPVVKTSNGRKITIPQALETRQFGKIYIMLGLNELGWNSTKSFTEHYGRLINLLRKTQPNAVIYAQGILPVSAERSANDAVFTNDRVALFNQLIASVCAEKQVYYVDAGKGVADQTGCMPADATPDGIHMNKATYFKWYDYLKTHTITTGD